MDAYRNATARELEFFILVQKAQPEGNGGKRLRLRDILRNAFRRGKTPGLADAIKAGYQSVPTDVQLEDEDEEEFPEGRVLYRVHRQRERNSSLIKKKKAAASLLRCEVCDFDFVNVYGEVGRGFIECHHTIPISDYTANQRTKLDDLALVCANCHRMLHRRRPWLSIDELRAIVSKWED